MKMICIIPARSGSKGVPGKNIKMLNGKPLLQYTIEFARELNLFDTICLSTDSEEIRQVGLNSGIEVPFVRPDDLSSDHSSSFDVIKHAVDFYNNEYHITFNFVCLLQPTVPFRSVDFFRPRIYAYINNATTDSIVSMRQVPHQFSPNWIFKSNPDNRTVSPLNLLDITKRRQELPTYYYRDGSLYLFKTENLLMKSIYGKSISPMILSDQNDFNIDTYEDWLRAEEYARSLQSWQL